MSSVATITPESLFQQLLDYRNQTGALSALGPWLETHVQTCRFPELHRLPFAAATYTRTCIARETTDPHHGFEALLMRWDKQAQTSIHGHPAFSFYHVISGVFEMELFSDTPQTGLQLTEIRRFYPAHTTWFSGPAGRYNNFIHRVTCLQPGLTFHIYSDDAQKGIAYEKSNSRLFPADIVPLIA